MKSTIKIVELFAGIGGVSAAINLGELPRFQVVEAIDIDQKAKSVYEANYAACYRIAEIASLKLAEFNSWAADFWWMSPPCLPFSIRGQSSRLANTTVDDLDDLRNQAFLAMIRHIAELQPSVIAIENVPGFESSKTFALLKDALVKSHYQFKMWLACPTDFGGMNRRRRVYVVAWKPDRCSASCPNFDPDFSRYIPYRTNDVLESAICHASHPELFLDPKVADKYSLALDRVTEAELLDGRKPTACFASSYGKTYLHAGSYLQDREGLRWFSPLEVQRQLGYPDTFRWPEGLSLRSQWSLLGNSLSIPMVASILRWIDQTLR